MALEKYSIKNATFWTIFSEWCQISEKYMAFFFRAEKTSQKTVARFSYSETGS
jgi:hypothetical protein